MTKVLSVLLLAVASCCASTIVLVDTPNGINGPYTLAVDGQNTWAWCVNFSLPLLPDWEGTVKPLSDFSPSDQILFREAWWITQNDSDPVTAQEGAWDVFGGALAASRYPGGLPWVALAQTNYVSVGLDAFSVIVPSDGWKTQDMMIPPDGHAPEPGTLIAGVALIGMGVWRKKK